jgi:hypothetical protein
MPTAAPPGRPESDASERTNGSPEVSFEDRAGLVPARHQPKLRLVPCGESGRGRT